MFCDMGRDRKISMMSSPIPPKSRLGAFVRGILDRIQTNKKNSGEGKKPLLGRRCEVELHCDVHGIKLLDDRRISSSKNGQLFKTLQITDAGISRGQVELLSREECTWQVPQMGKYFPSSFSCTSGFNDDDQAFTSTFVTLLTLMIHS